MEKSDLISKLKEAKELRDLEVITKEEYEEIVKKYKPQLLDELGSNKLNNQTANETTDKNIKDYETFTFSNKPFIIKKLANALIKDASINGVTNVFFDVAGATGSKIVIEGLKKIYGGLWVGGTAYLYDDRIEFKPNKMNLALTKGLTDIILPLNKIVDINLEFGVVTKIINIATLNGTLKIRCSGANKFLEEIINQKKTIDSSPNKNTNNPLKSEIEEILSLMRRFKTSNYEQIFDCYTIFIRDFGYENSEINNIIKSCAKKQFRAGEEKMFYNEYISRKVQQNPNYINELDIRNIVVK